MAVNVAAIGLGVMGQRMLANMAAHPAFEVVTAWDPAPEACRQTLQRYPKLDLAGDPAAAVSDPRVHVVYVACPPALHGHYARMAAAAGKDVFCEKPLAIDLEDGRATVQALRDAGRRNAVNFSLASAPAADYVVDRLASGELGDVVGVDMRFHFARWPRDWQASAKWLLEREQGGFTREVISHYVYLCRRLFGEGTFQGAAVRYPPVAGAAETQVLADLDFGGVPASVAGRTGGAGPDQVEFTVWGTRASCRLSDWTRVAFSDGATWDERLTEIDNKRQAGYRRTLDNAAARFTGERSTMPTVRDALAVQEIVEAILAA